MKGLIPAIVVSLAVIGAPLLAIFEPVQGDQAAVVFPPGWTHSEVMTAAARADLSLVRFGVTQNIAIIAVSDTEAITALRREGAWLLLPPGALGGCLLRPEDRDLVLAGLDRKAST